MMYITLRTLKFYMDSNFLILWNLVLQPLKGDNYLSEDENQKMLLFFKCPGQVILRLPIGYMYF